MGSGVELRGIHHIALKTTDVERIAAFYRDVVGLREMRRNDDERGLRSIWLETAGVILMIERSGRTEGEGGGRDLRDFSDDPPGLHLIAFSIASSTRTAWREHLVSSGHAVVAETKFTIYTRDPDGNRVGLSSWPELGES
jgi:catechol 2,3-dioxygenase-like lactoylglutathione lyase family enzyme